MFEQEERDAAGANKRDIGTATSYVRPFWNAMYLGGRCELVLSSLSLCTHPHTTTPYQRILTRHHSQESMAVIR